MLIEFHTWKATTASPEFEAAASLRLLPQGLDAKPPILLGVTPVARLNPFQTLLYSAFPQNGIAHTPVTNPQQFDRLISFKGMAETVLVHFHWLNFVIGSETDQHAAASAVESFQKQILALKSKGGRIMWTVHNLMPHDSQHYEADLALRRLMAAQADILHFMTTASKAALGELVTLDDRKAVVCPHPNYRGCYSDYYDQYQARFALGIEADELVFVMFGALKAYKGLENIIPAVREVKSRLDRRVRVVIAGAPDEAAGVKEFVKAAMVDPDILICPRTIRPEEVQIFLRAADVGLVPYSGGLNSGALQLYRTFGLPTVVPAVASLVESTGEVGCVAFAVDDPAALGQAMGESADLVGAPTTQAILDSISEQDPTAVSNRLATTIREKLG